MKEYKSYTCKKRVNSLERLIDVDNTWCMKRCHVCIVSPNMKVEIIKGKKEYLK
jgi:hypothetical protein